MIRGKLYLLTFTFLFATFRISGQDLEDITMQYSLDLPDTAKQVSIEDLYNLIFANHPVVKQAELLNETARQEIRLARGAFDPKLQASWSKKEFKGTEYYNILNTSLKVPVWFPVDPKIGVDRNRGVFLNPEKSIPESTNNWQITTGISLPIGRGLIIDDRRATVKQALIFRDLYEAQQIKIINKILLQASKDYWNWYFNYHNYLLLRQSVDIAQQIFDMVKLNFQLGESAVIDTVQAKITLQNRMIETQEANIELIRSRLELSNHLWGESEEPLELDEHAAPILRDSIETIPDFQKIENLRDLARNNHPELLKLQAKSEQLFVKNQLNRENLKPRLDINYSLIDQPVDPNGEVSSVAFDNNYKIGLDFSFPIFLRKERARIQKTNIEILETEYEINLNRKRILNQVDAYYAELINTSGIIDQQQQAVNNYQRLLQAELLNLQSGESDLFKINFQQEKLIRAQAKLVKLKSGFEKTKMSLLWAAGVRNLDIN